MITDIMENPPFNEQEILYRVSQVADLPPLPLALQRLLQMVQHEIGSLKDLEKVIRYDQALSARILRLANSAFFGCRGKTNTLARALILIGLEQAKRICLCALLLELFSSGTILEPQERERIWKHAFATARMASEVAAKRRWVSPDEAYLLGLLHDLGKLIMALHFREHYQAISELARHRKVPTWCVESEYGMSHAVIGKWVAVKWSFPEVFHKVIEFHHHPDRSPTFKSEVKLIHLANVLVISREHPELLTDARTLDCCRDLFVTEDEWNGYQARMELIWPEVDQFWALLV